MFVCRLRWGLGGLASQSCRFATLPRAALATMSTAVHAATPARAAGWRRPQPMGRPAAGGVSSDAALLCPDDRPTSRGAARSWEFPQSRRKANIPPGRASINLRFSAASIWRPSYKPWQMPGLRPGGLSIGCEVLVSSICSNTRMNWRELSTMAKSSGMQLGKVRRAPGHVSSCLPHSERDSKTRISAPWRAPSDWRLVPIRVIDGAMNSAFAFLPVAKGRSRRASPHGLG